MSTESTNGVTELASAVRRAGTTPLPIAAASRPLTDAEVFGPDDDLGNSERAQRVLDRAAHVDHVFAAASVSEAARLDFSEISDDAFNNPTHIVEAQDEPTPDRAPTTPETAVPDSDDAEPEPWPHQTIEFAGGPIQVRKPDTQAMVAFSLVNGKGASPEVQTRVFALFIRKHMSPESFEDIVGRLIDPDDSDVSLDELIKALITME